VFDHVINRVFMLNCSFVYRPICDIYGFQWEQ